MYDPSYVKEFKKNELSSFDYALLDAYCALKEEGEKEISVRLLADRAGVERNDFYRCYDSTLSFIERVEEDTVARMNDLASAEDESYYARLFSFFRENDKEIMAILDYPAYREDLISSIALHFTADDKEGSQMIYTKASIVFSTFYAYLHYSIDVDFSILRDFVS
ncbi:MAG TPA: hypothetical protein IAB12_05365 [Candidatus Ornithospirochaeta avicola]|uniref:Uncharacterized protein n=1 Tax=Candidatus Ornithospirochaeta avicola TaxID=2840896 RepID=A0A9D1PTA7_9SPIO|nr:hypothetical protein [Candidatus Ornithospirochaeta avicola]